MAEPAAQLGRQVVVSALFVTRRGHILHLHLLGRVGQGVLHTVRSRCDLTHRSARAGTHVLVRGVLLRVALGILRETVVHRCAEEALRRGSIQQLRSSEIALGIL